MRCGGRRTDWILTCSRRHEASSLINLNSRRHHPALINNRYIGVGGGGCVCQYGGIIPRCVVPQTREGRDTSNISRGKCLHLPGYQVTACGHRCSRDVLAQPRTFQLKVVHINIPRLVLAQTRMFRLKFLYSSSEVRACTNPDVSLKVSRQI